MKTHLDKGIPFRSRLQYDYHNIIHKNIIIIAIVDAIVTGLTGITVASKSGGGKVGLIAIDRDYKSRGNV